MARTGRPVIPISLSETEKDFLRKLSAKRSAPAAEVKRAKSILLMAEGLSNKAISERVGFCAATVGSLRSRFDQLRLDGISDLPRSGPPRKIGDDRIEALIEKTLHTKPKGATHWSTRKMAKKMGISPDSVSRIWCAFGLKPHRADSFQISTDPHYVDKVRDVVGLYMSPPENALVLCVDEKSQIQALERSQPVLPMRPGKPEGHTPEYYRHGTTSLFAALDVKSGKVLGKCYPRHRAKEFLAFLRNIESHVAGDVAAGKEVHLVLDNYATHKSATVMKWLIKRPHWHLHFTPTHASWLNQVERFFALITNEAIRRGNFVSVEKLVTAIRKYLDVHNEDPKPFVWTASADRILEKTVNFCKSIV
jgi:transposase